MNICLLGDSILDNVTYTDGAPAVTDHLNRLLGGNGRATLLAVDGSVTAQVHRQVRELPADATHLVLSSGGNDALAHEDLLRQPAKSVAQALLLFAEPLRTLEADYRRQRHPPARKGDGRLGGSRGRRLSSRYAGLVMIFAWLRRFQSGRKMCYYE